MHARIYGRGVVSVHRVDHHVTEIEKPEIMFYFEKVQIEIAQPTLFIFEN
jgi:hypothetical protein